MVTTTLFADVKGEHPLVVKIARYVPLEETEVV